jgi:glutamate racemase
MNNSPIGVLDSGSGGLSIYLSLRRLLPRESISYIGDHKFNPYGDKSIECIKEWVTKLIPIFAEKEFKLIVIACNTATIAGIDYFEKICTDSHNRLLFRW